MVRTPEAFDTSDLFLNLPYPPPSSWGNLGDWTQTDDYPTAAKQLATRLGHFAELRPGMQVCDLGFGCGDQFRVWQEDFGVGFIRGFNPSQSQYNWAHKQWEEMIKAGKVKIDCAPHLALLKTHDSFDRILALDCAYHFSQREAFLSQAKKHLSREGCLVWTDLLLGDLSCLARLKVRLFAKLAHIPFANLQTEIDYKSMWSRTGYNLELHDISKNVFPGIARYLDIISQRWCHTLSLPARLRYRITARAARWAAETGGLRYVMLKAQPKTQG
jgi:hypothetical protein